MTSKLRVISTIVRFAIQVELEENYFYFQDFGLVVSVTFKNRFEGYVYYIIAFFSHFQGVEVPYNGFVLSGSRYLDPND